ncbi:MAG: hypothetical protein M3Z64_03280 [Verrucomicrobiota bacterium]|nr:hypothetical protein [Verrucomicrobiota bacterium]
MHRTLIPVAAAAVVAFLPLVMMADPVIPGASGVEGVISVSPSHAGPSRRDTPDSAPVADMPFVVKKGDATIASFTTDAKGHFQVSLPPGHYIVLREDAGAAIGHWQFEVDVAAGEMAKVTWTGDSGMR